jgi:hypothetical protein
MFREMGLPVKGSCLCGGIAFEINGPLSDPLNCHCSMCRKAHGAAFRSRAGVATADFRFLKGEELLKFYESSPGTHRGFCQICGSPIISRFDFDPGVLGLPMGSLDGDSGIEPRRHVHVSAKAPWHRITDDLPTSP